MKQFKKKIITALLATTMVMSQFVPVNAMVNFSKSIDSWYKDGGYKKYGSVTETTTQNAGAARVDQSNLFYYSINGVSYALIDLGGRNPDSTGGRMYDKDKDVSLTSGKFSIDYTAPDNRPQYSNDDEPWSTSKVFKNGNVMKVMLKQEGKYVFNINNGLYTGEVTIYSDSDTAPSAVYGKKDMSFGEFYRNTSTNSPSSNAIDSDPMLTFSGYNANPISSSTYEYDADHTVPDAKLITESYYKYSKANSLNAAYKESEMNKIIGVNDVDVVMNWDLYANYMLVALTDLNVPAAQAAYNDMKSITPTYFKVDGKFYDITKQDYVKTDNIDVYAAKVLLDPNVVPGFGGRAIVNDGYAKSFETIFGGIANYVVDYNTDMADVAGKDYVVLSAEFTNFTKDYQNLDGTLNLDKFWNDFTDKIYGGTVKNGGTDVVYTDANGKSYTGLRFLQNMWMDKEKPVLYIALPSAVAKNYNITLYVDGLKDIRIASDITDFKMAPTRDLAAMTPSVEAAKDQTTAAKFTISGFGYNSKYLAEISAKNVTVVRGDGMDVTSLCKVTKDTFKTNGTLVVTMTKEMFETDGFAGDYYVMIPKTANYGNIQIPVTITVADAK